MCSGKSDTPLLPSTFVALRILISMTFTRDMRARTLCTRPCTRRYSAHMHTSKLCTKPFTKYAFSSTACDYPLEKDVCEFASLRNIETVPTTNKNATVPLNDESLN